MTSSRQSDYATGTARHSALVAGGTLISRLTGLVRIVVIGAVLGPTYFGNSFVTANLLPTQAYLLIAGHALAPMIVPAVLRATAQRGPAHATELLGRVGGFLVTASGAITGLLLITSPLLAWVLTFGIDDPVARGTAQELTVVMILLMAPQVMCYTAAAFGTAAQQARGRFVLAAVAPVVENLVVIGVVLFAGAMWGTGLEVGDVPLGLLLTLSIGSTLAVVAHACVQLFGAARVGLPVRPRMQWRADPETVDVARRIGKSVTVAITPTAGMLLLVAAGTTVPGGAIVVQTAYLAYSSALALGSRAVSTVILPGMSAAVERGDSTGFAAAWRKALSYAAITGLPPLLLLGMLSHPIATALAHGELRSAALIDQLAGCLVVVGLAQLVAGVHLIGRQALYARLDIVGPRRGAAMTLGVSFAVVVGSLFTPPGEVRLVILCVALFAGELAGVTLVLARLRRAIRSERLVEWTEIVGVVAAAVAMVPVVVVGRWFLDSQGVDQIGTVAMLGVCGLLALAIYALVLRTSMNLWTGRTS
ncbi:lipid II flippase MurJ [Saccharopolyspora sp. NPDC002686]|uniref:murein biosynthesis integral membrane protein MurJ n=1 Tax=Saccharopolyspora sp. NPDC002686 TaxID=3154541 RepID=UPI0033257D4B